MTEPTQVFKLCELCKRIFQDLTRPKNKRVCGGLCAKQWATQKSMKWIAANKDRYLKNRRSWKAAAVGNYQDSKEDPSYYL